MRAHRHDPQPHRKVTRRAALSMISSASLLSTDRQPGQRGMERRAFFVYGASPPSIASHHISYIPTLPQACYSQRTCLRKDRCA